MITATQVNELRQKTKVGMMLCKQALEATNGNQEQAIEWLRKNGNAISSGSDESKSNTFDVVCYYDHQPQIVFYDTSNVTFNSPDGKVIVSVNDTSGDWHTLYAGQGSYFKLRAHKD